MKKILIVEDDELVANIYGSRFSREGFQVKIALDGASGLDLVLSFRPDVVILDLVLPRMTGLELIKRIRAQSELAQLPIIVFSNAYLTSMMHQAGKAGATKCLSKDDCAPKQVLEVVRGVLAPESSGAPAPSPAPARTAEEGQPFSVQAATDEEFQAELGRSFLAGLPAALEGLRSLLPGLLRSDDEVVLSSQLQALHRRVRALAGNAGLAGLSHIAQTANALEALLKQLYENPAATNASALRTVALAIDFLAFLLARGLAPDSDGAPPPSVLVVDDEVISRRAVTYALNKARLKSTALESPTAALELLSRERFDLVVLDVDMPGMTGFDLCHKLRALPGHHDTPVVFVTGLSDFTSRANSTVSGGNDLIAKPFLFMELAVKALVHVLRARLQRSEAGSGQAN
jgi:DNA-binding response OmpR family regulator